MLVAAGLAGARDHALISVLALNGLRVSEAIGADIERLGLERGHRTLVVHRKGGKTVTIPLAPRTARAVDLAIGERCSGPIFTMANGARLDRHGASRIAATRRSPCGDHQTSWATHPTARLHHRRPGCRCAVACVQEAASHADPRTTMRYDRARVSLDRHATYIVSALLRSAPRPALGGAPTCRSADELRSAWLRERTPGRISTSGGGWPYGRWQSNRRDVVADAQFAEPVQ